MPCYHPIPAYQLSDGSVVFAERKGQDSVRDLELPCGQCVGCRLTRSRHWAIRCIHEAQLHRENCFITLTYRVAPVSLDYHDFQVFIRALRDRIRPRSVRFFMCGEYGEQFSRPHFHACLFGYTFPDQYRIGKELFRAPLLEVLWPHGFASIGEVTLESAAYVARYLMKKVTGKGAERHYRCVDPETGELHDRVPEFCQMSRRPGIGAEWIDKFRSDVYPRGLVVVKGKEVQPPKYYDRRFARDDPEAFEELLEVRARDGRSRSDDNTRARLAVKEVVAEARLRFLKREVE